MNGLLIRDTRIALGISRRSLAEVLEVTPTRLGEVERGKRPVPGEWEQRLTSALSDWSSAMRTCVANKYPEYSAMMRKPEPKAMAGKDTSDTQELSFAEQYAEARWQSISGWDELARVLEDFAGAATMRAQEFERKLTRVIEERDELLRKNEALRRGNDQYEVACKFYRETGVGIGTCQELVAELRKLAESKFTNGYQSSAYLRAAELAEEKLKPVSVDP